MKRIPFAIVLIVLSYSLTGPANYSGIEGKEGLGYAPDRIIIKYKSHLNTREIKSAQSRTGLAVRELTSHIHAVSISPGKSIAQSIAEAECNPDVEFAEPDYIRKISTVANDPYYPSQWALADIEASRAWDLTTGDGGIKIVIIDTGVNVNHPDLVPNIIDGWDFVDNDNWAMDVYGHGTKMAGVASGRGNNGIGISGVSWNSSIMPLRAGNASGELYVSAIVQAIDYAVASGAKIISASYAGSTYSSAEYESMSHAAVAGLLFVAAAGNDGANLDCCPVYPAAYNLPNLITVASVNPEGKLSSFSNFSMSRVHLAAPGERIWSTSHSIREVYSASFDESDGGWTLDKWIRTSSHSYSPGYSLSNSIDNGRYENNVSATAVSPAISLVGAAGSRLHYEFCGSSELNCDFLSVDVSVNGGAWSSRTIYVNNVPFTRLSGSTLNTWKLAYVDLGEFDGQSSVRFRLHFTSDGVNTDEGFFIDNIKIMAGATAAGTYGSGSGTSFSAPHVAGLAGLIWSKYPAYSAEQVKNVIFNSVTKSSSLKGVVFTGGKMNAFQALNNPKPDTVFQPTVAELQSAASCSSSVTSSGGGGGGGGGGCFIATAAFGSPLEPQVMTLRNFRDNVLARSEAGRQFIRIYYRYSPAVAELIKKSDLLRTAARNLLLPFVAFSHILLLSAWQLCTIILVIITFVLLIHRNGKYEKFSSD